ncbi:AAA family ATPase [Rudaeicoccus suwonensis]|uniref:MoxR-like ATPase n=1 Tax=Rudaeicoccus suwonensis TaxID=657409 RepID=A0A561E8Z7_9MICO|nr:MoxR family ATPase [Rudaeicoccus suwonensis]TWE12071.1 MoxR-like ATPase [Rudaeicoccus suwonensis]
MSTPAFVSVDDARDRLGATGYLASEDIATTAYLAAVLGRPLLVEGPAGVGKTALAGALAAATDSAMLRLQCYEGVDEARALYEWNHAKQLLRITAEQSGGWDDVRTDIFGEEFLLERPLLAAVRAQRPTVLLIDELDKADEELEGLLLELLSEFQITIPELGTIRAAHRPMVVVTSNASRELSEALRRRCLFLHIDYPDAELEQRIVKSHVPDLDDELAASLVRVIGALRGLDLRKAPSVAETVDWASTLVSLDADRLDPELVRRSLGVILKHRSDIELATTKLDLDRELAG